MSVNPIVIVSDGRVKVCCGDDMNACVEFEPAQAKSSNSILRPSPVPPPIGSYLDRQVTVEADATYLSQNLEQMDQAMAQGAFGKEVSDNWERAPVVIAAQPHDPIHIQDFESIAEWATTERRELVVGVGEWVQQMAAVTETVSIH
jgi:hypothetical protein